MPGRDHHLRVRAIVDRPPNADGRYVLYWMLAARRPSWNFALDRAADWARELGRPLLVLERMRCDYRWACDRLHRFVIDGMHDNRRAFAEAGVGYYPYLEPAPRAGDGLVAALAADAAVVVTDRAPVFDLAVVARGAAPEVRVRFEEVDGNGILPLDAVPHDHVFPTAYAFRRFLQRELPAYLGVRPRAAGVVRGQLAPPVAPAAAVLQRWPMAGSGVLETGDGLAALPIDHRIGVAPLRGGPVAARQRLKTFVEEQLTTYDTRRNDPDEDAGSGLSPYLHFGHVSPHDVLARVLRHDGWQAERLAAAATGSKAGWWGASAPVEAFLDQLVTWRELGFNMAARRPDYDTWESLPAWARQTLEAHAGDPRPSVYSLDEFAAAATHDPLWNAAQRQLAGEGRMHNYLRMLWGKKILHWTRSPREALDVMIELNNRYAIDGRDPNSYTGIFWVLGRYDRPWPERPIFGSVRYMTSESTMRKLHVKQYLRRYGGRLFD